MLTEILKEFVNSGNAAFATSLFAIFIAWRANKKQHRLVDIEEAREKDRIIKEKQANLTASIITEELPGHPRSNLYTQYYIEIKNDGPAAARDIVITLNGKLLLESELGQNLEKIATPLGPKKKHAIRCHPKSRTS